MTRQPLKLAEAGNLRLPVPFFDLFMVLLICFMMFLAPTPRPSLDTSSIDVPLSRDAGETDVSTLMPAVPRRQGTGWIYELIPDGRRLAAADLATAATAGRRKVVLVVPATVNLQQFIEMQADLRSQKIEFGLAVREEARK